MPITPELRKKVIKLSQAGYGRNKIERELAGQISRTSISTILREHREESSAVEGGKNKLPPESCLVPNPNPNPNLQIDGQMEDTGNTSMDKTSVVKDGIPGSSLTSKEDEDEGDDEDLPFPNAMKSESKYEVDSIQHQYQPPSPLPPIPPLTAVAVQAQAQAQAAVAVQPVTPTITVNPITPPSAEPQPEPEEDIMMGCDWVLELKQKKIELEERERQVAEVQDILPLARELKELGWEEHALAWVQTIHECSDMEDIDLSEATQKVMELVKHMSNIRKVVSYVYRQ